MKKTVLELRNARGGGTNAEACKGFAGNPRSTRVHPCKEAPSVGGLCRRLEGFIARKSPGLKGNLTLDLSPGYGYTGIVVAMLAMLNPLGVIAAAIFVAGIFVGADAMSRSANVPSYIAEVMVATSLLTMVAAIMLMRYRVRWR